MTRQTANARNAGHTHQLAAAACLHGGDEWVEGGGQSRAVGCVDVGHHVQVFTFGCADAVTDACAGQHHVGHALAGHAGVARCHECIRDTHVGLVCCVTRSVDAVECCPVENGLLVPRHQRQPPTCLVKTHSQRLTNAAGCACDEHQRCGAGRRRGHHGNRTVKAGGAAGSRPAIAPGYSPFCSRPYMSFRFR